MFFSIGELNKSNLSWIITFLNLLIPAPNYDKKS